MSISNFENQNVDIFEYKPKRIVLEQWVLC